MEGLDTDAMSTGLDKRDLERMLRENMNALEKAPVIQRWSQEDASRRFLLRPKGGGSSLRLTPASGDLLVLGGTCQRTWEHSVPKCATAGPRISVMFREGY